jgi:hypothetical protein
MYTSKAKYRSEIRAQGYVEVGNDPSIRRPDPEPAEQALADLPPVEHDLKRVFEQNR